jgi:hypothetical protein
VRAEQLAVGGLARGHPGLAWMAPAKGGSGLVPLRYALLHLNPLLDPSIEEVTAAFSIRFWAGGPEQKGPVQA